MKRLGKEQREITKETTAEAGSAAVTSLPRNQVEALWGDHVQLDLCIASLDEDGLIEILPDGSLRLPQ
jgi:A/G-specific adenine glycosylase